jgi:sulfate permease, SulP family
MNIDKPDNLAGEFWGGFAAMLVALPSAIAFGVTIFSPLGSSYAAQGAVAGMLGAAALGLVAAVLGGTKRLISAPCAPAAAVLSAFAIEFSHGGMSPQTVVVLLMLIALAAGLLQVLFGIVGLGRLIKYMPYPVVSGYLTGVGLIIVLSQTPRLLGAPQQTSLWEAVRSPALWRWEAIAIGVITMAVVILAAKLTKALPATILGLGAGILAYFAIAAFSPDLLALEGNKLVIGPLAGSGENFIAAGAKQWGGLGSLAPGDLGDILMPALTLAVLLSIDTLKTCVVLDALTRSRHNSNQELIGQGAGNIAAALAGGVPGAGTMGATLVNTLSGGQTRVSGIIEGAFVLIALLLLGRLISWVPIAALAGILIVIGFRMFDRDSLHLLRSRSTILDFFVIVIVVLVAETVSLIAASGVGVALAVFLFIRQQVGGAVIRRKTTGAEMFSKRVRLPDEMAILEKRGGEMLIIELQGSLFFGTADQLLTALDGEVKSRTYIVLDFRRVQSIDVTAAHVLERIKDSLAEREGLLIFSDLPRVVPTGQQMDAYFRQLGLVRSGRHARTFPELDVALEWVEDRLIEEEHVEREAETPLDLRDINLFAGRKEKTMLALEKCVESRSFKAGETIFARGDRGGELFLIRSGLVRVELPLKGEHQHHLATFGRGDFFGEMSFLDGNPRSANAVAYTDTAIFVLAKERFDEIAEEHKRLALNLMSGVAHVLAIRLRYANSELRMLRDQEPD